MWISKIKSRIFKSVKIRLLSIIRGLLKLGIVKRKERLARGKRAVSPGKRSIKILSFSAVTAIGLSTS